MLAVIIHPHPPHVRTRRECARHWVVSARSRARTASSMVAAPNAARVDVGFGERREGLLRLMIMVNYSREPPPC